MDVTKLDMINKNVLRWFLLICKNHTLNTSANLLSRNHPILFFIKGNTQFVQKVTFEPSIDSKQSYYGSWKYYKTWYFYKFSLSKLQKRTITFFVTVLINISHEKNNRWFWGLHKNIKCVFPLRRKDQPNTYELYD